MSDRLPRSVERTRKAATWAGSFNTDPRNGLANAKKETAARRGDRDTAIPSNGVSIKVSNCCLRPSSGGAATGNPVYTRQKSTEVSA